MIFQNEIENIENIANEIESNCIGDECIEIGKIQIFIQGYLPGLLSRIGSEDRNLFIDINKFHNLFISTVDYNGKTFFGKSSSVKHICKLLNELFVKMLEASGQ
ncbi:MAG: hypothetical protein ACRCY3_14910 [Sphingorhabdus sp.]